VLSAELIDKGPVPNLFPPNKVAFSPKDMQINPLGFRKNQKEAFGTIGVRPKAK
jgi:hypothetical protein